MIFFFIEKVKIFKNIFVDYFHLDLNLEDLSYKAADIIIYYPCTTEDFCATIRKISKYICVQISQELDKRIIINDLSVDESSSDSEYEDLHYIDY